MLEVGDLVVCTVDRIVGTVVFVKILEENKEIEGSIVTSEIAPGRIRNLRDYVVPKKRIVCKVLRITSQGNVELSLRRVTLKEKKEMTEYEKQEKNYTGILKGVLKEKALEIIEKISKEEKVSDFLQRAKSNPELLEKFIDKKDSEKILEILNSQKQKKKEIKKEIFLSTTRPEGIELIKEILGNIKDIEIKYISAGRYSFRIQSANPKLADNKLKEVFSHIEKEAKKKDMEFSIKN
jgi:translation initiation factor 2 alpha subunit (eIF-2alpha)